MKIIPMPQAFPERLRSARLLKGLSMQDLADNLDIPLTRQAIYKYEKGDVHPDSAMVALLGKALGVPVDFFYRTLTVELGVIEFRKLHSLPSKEEAQIIEKVKDHLSRYIELEEILSVSNCFVSPLVDSNPILTFEDVESAAQRVREEWALGDQPISNTIETLEERYVKVVEVDAGDSFDGMQTMVNGKIPLIALNKGKIKSLDRKRFTVLHELGHLLLPLDGVPEDKKEIFCHQFAGAMLLPKESILRQLGTSRKNISIQELAALKQQYGISMQAIMMRSKDLGIITENYCRQFFYFMKQKGWRVTEPYDYIGNESSTRFEKLLYRAYAEEIISMGKAASLKNQSLVEFRDNL